MDRGNGRENGNCQQGLGLRIIRFGKTMGHSSNNCEAENDKSNPKDLVMLHTIGIVLRK